MSTKYQPSKVKISINGTDVGNELLENILQLSVEESLHFPSMCLITLNNSYYPGRVKEDKPWENDSLLKIGNTIDVTFTSSTTEEFKEQNQDKLFSGEITGIECHFNKQSQAPIVIRAYDISHRLHRGRYNRSFQNMTDSDIVKKNSGTNGYSSGKYC